MHKRIRDVSSRPRRLRGKYGASLGERTTVVAAKIAKTALEATEVTVIEWLDAMAQGEWHEPKREDLLCKTAGFIVFEDKEQVEIAGTITDGMVNNSITIPKQMIIKRKVIQIETTVSESKGKKPTKVGKRPNT